MAEQPRGRVRETSVTTGGDYAHVYSLARRVCFVWGFSKHNFDYNNMSPDAARRVDEEIGALVKTFTRKRAI